MLTFDHDEVLNLSIMNEMLHDFHLRRMWDKVWQEEDRWEVLEEMCKDCKICELKWRTDEC